MSPWKETGSSLPLLDTYQVSPGDFSLGGRHWEHEVSLPGGAGQERTHIRPPRAGRAGTHPPHLHPHPGGQSSLSEGRFAPWGLLCPQEEALSLGCSIPRVAPQVLSLHPSIPSIVLLVGQHPEHHLPAFMTPSITALAGWVSQRERLDGGSDKGSLFPAAAPWLCRNALIAAEQKLLLCRAFASTA